MGNKGPGIKKLDFLADNLSKIKLNKSFVHVSFFAAKDSCFLWNDFLDTALAEWNNPVFFIESHDQRILELFPKKVYSNCFKGKQSFGIVFGKLSSESSKVLSTLSPRTAGLAECTVFDEDGRYINFGSQDRQHKCYLAMLPKKEFQMLYKKLQKEKRFAVDKYRIKRIQYYRLFFGTSDALIEYDFNLRNKDTEIVWRLFVKKALKWKDPRILGAYYADRLKELEKFEVKDSWFTNPLLQAGALVESHLNKQTSKIVTSVKAPEFGVINLALFDPSSIFWVDWAVHEQNLLSAWLPKSMKPEIEKELRRKGTRYVLAKKRYAGHKDGRTGFVTGPHIILEFGKHWKDEYSICLPFDESSKKYPAPPKEIFLLVVRHGLDRFLLKYYTYPVDYKKIIGNKLWKFKVSERIKYKTRYPYELHLLEGLLNKESASDLANIDFNYTNCFEELKVFSHKIPKNISFTPQITLSGFNKKELKAFEKKLEKYQGK